MKPFKKIMKCLLAGITAFAILCFIIIPYSLTPIHIENPEGNTDYVWAANSLWCKMTEGISFGKFDAKGYNNTQVIEDPDIVIMGSSHTEAVNVMPSESYAAVLGKHFEGIYTTYNMGISDHFFLKQGKYLPKTVQMNPAAKYIIMETYNVIVTQEDVDSLLRGTVAFTPSHNSGLIGLLQKLPFPRLVYQQLERGLKDMLLGNESEEESLLPKVPEETAPDEKAYDGLFAYLQKAMQDSDAQLIIMYHPTGVLQPDGSVSFGEENPHLTMFGAKCQEYGISFVDMTQPFVQMYETEYKLPHGFITGEIGAGHINADGHAKIAGELAKCIANLEEVA